MSLKSALNVTKRPATATPKENLQAKRSKKYAQKQNDVEEALKEHSKIWTHKATVTRALIADLTLPTTGAYFIELLDKIRDLDSRCDLTTSEKAAIPLTHDLIASVLPQLFQNPLTSDISSFPLSFHTQTIDEDQELRKDNRAQFYVRRLVFSSHDKLIGFLTSLELEKPQYKAHLNIILELSSNLPSGVRYLHYAGMTVANDPLGRELDDEASERDSLITAAVQLYQENNGEVEEFEALALRFDIGAGGTDSVLAARHDLRIELYESLLIDTFSCFSLNTASPGNVIRTKIDAEFAALKEAVAKYSFA